MLSPAALWSSVDLQVTEAMYSLTALFVLIGASRVLASPVKLEARAVTALSVSELNSYSPYTQFARAAYCEVTTAWNCGGAFLDAHNGTF